MKQKTIWTLPLVIGLISLTSVFSCKKKVDNEIIADYIYINQSNNDIKIHYLSLGTDSIFVLNKSTTLKLSEDLMAGGTYIISRADSVKVIYDAVKFSIFTKEDTTGILRLDSYNYKRLKENHHEYTFIFTEEDYNSATLIE